MLLIQSDSDDLSTNDVLDWIFFIRPGKYRLAIPAFLKVVRVKFMELSCLGIHIKLQLAHVSNSYASSQ